METIKLSARWTLYREIGSGWHCPRCRTDVTAIVYCYESVAAFDGHHWACVACAAKEKLPALKKALFLKGIVW